jgi:hypothetical protein
MGVPTDSSGDNDDDAGGEATDGGVLLLRSDLSSLSPASVLLLE